jgi:hypothetical protein
MSALIITPAYTDICRELRAAILASGLPVLPAFEHSDLPRVRSMLITQALTSPDVVDRLILVDSDIVPTGAQLQELATSPLVTAENALTGLYPTRDGKGWAVHAKDPQEAAERPGGVFEAEWAGLGFCAIDRESLERVARYLPLVTAEGAGPDWTPFCVPELEYLSQKNARYFPDDRVLWRNLEKVGVRLWADSGLKVGHVIRAVLRNPIG